jgi:competence protein ComEC
MLNWQEVPFVRLLLPFVGGVLLAAAQYLDHWSLQTVLLLFALAYFGLWSLTSRPLGYRYRWVSGVAVMSGSFLLALSSWQLHSPEKQAHHYINQGDETQYYLFRINAITPSSTGKSNRLELAILGFGKQPGSLSQIRGRSFTYLPADFLFSVGQYGIARGQFQAISPPRHPGSFDFARFMAQKGMVRQLYIPDQQVYLLEEAPFFSLAAQIKTWSAALQSRLAHLLPDRSAGLIIALVLGQKNQLDPEVKADYATVGAMHVLAVSGMHVGIVAMGLQFLLAFWRKPGLIPKIVKASLSVSGIWLFALLAGAGPSVMRAATMFSLFTVGRELYLPKNVWNILAATALLMLCLNPRTLFAVGFQLSYAAVAAIVYFQPRIYRLWLLHSRPFDYAWQLLSLGLAAQLGTAAISIHYFHQFPLYFWLSGLVIVPLATLALLLGLALLILGGIPILGELIATALDWLVRLMNQSMAWIADLPASSIQSLHLSGNSTLLVLGLLLGAVLYYHYRPLLLRWGLLVGLLLLLWQQNLEIQRSWAQQEYLIYASRSGLGLTLIDGRQALTYVSDSTVLNDIAYAKQAFLQEKRTRQSEERRLPAGSQVIHWQDQKILWLPQWIDPCQAEVSQADLVLIGVPFQEKYLSSMQEMAPQRILIHPSLSYRQQDKWKKALQHEAQLQHYQLFSQSYYHQLK